MAVYFANTEITGIKDLFPLSSKDITGLYFADTELFTVWGEYDGTLPATYSANGSTLADYRVYGSDGGVGDRTENLLNPNEMDAGYYISSGDSKLQNNNWNLYYVSVTPLSIYTSINLAPYASSAYIGVCDENKNVTGHISGPVGSAEKRIEVPENCYYLAVSVRVNAVNPMLVEGSTAPAEYIPYGYEVDMSVSGGTTSTTTPIYIGSDPLGEDEYVDYSEQKVYKRTAQVMPSAPAETKVQNGITIVCDGQGRYSLSGTSTNVATIDFPFPSFIIPISVGQGGSGTFSLFNGIIFGGAIYFLKSGVVVDAWQLNTAKRVSNSYSIMSGKEVNRIRFEIPSGKTISAKIMPMFTDDGDYPATYAPYYDPQNPPIPLPALPTVDGINVVDYAGQSAAVPERFIAKYRKEGFK